MSENRPEITLKRPRGRPPTGRTRTRTYLLRLTDEERADLRRLASASGLSIAAYLRAAVHQVGIL